MLAIQGTPTPSEMGDRLEWTVEASACLPPFDCLLPTNTTFAWLNRCIPSTRF